MTMESSAVFSPCRIYRYTLTRTWDPGIPPMCCIGLNPSTADETLNDPTVTRCINRARDWGHGGLVMLNLFAFRATDPNDMKRAYKSGQDVVGAENDKHILESCRDRTVLVAWGVHGRLADRDVVLTRLLREHAPTARLVCLGLTKDGAPKHPLYIAKSQPALLFTAGA